MVETTHETAAAAAAAAAAADAWDCACVEEESSMTGGCDGSECGMVGWCIALCTMCGIG